MSIINLNNIKKKNKKNKSNEIKKNSGIYRRNLNTIY